MHETLAQFRQGLARWKPLSGRVGRRLPTDPLPSSDPADFRPDPESPLAGAGARVFIPWALRGVVGQWHFRQFPDAGSPVILNRALYLQEEHLHRTMYREFPAWNLETVGANRKDFRPGPLEDWIPSALRFNGTDRFCRVRHADLVQAKTYSFRPKRPNRTVTASFDGTRRKTLDMDRNSFLVELVLRAEPREADRTVVEKWRDGTGYRLEIDPDGRPVLTAAAENRELSAGGSPLVRDGRWHHLVAEVDRQDAENPVRLYADGAAMPVALSGSRSVVGASLANTGDFLVGRGHEGRFFAGDLAFLRVARGTLRDAHTTIEELHAWQFDGPALRDFAGNAPAGTQRTPGALEPVASE